MMGDLECLRQFIFMIWEDISLCGREYLYLRQKFPFNKQQLLNLAYLPWGVQ